MMLRFKCLGDGCCCLHLPLKCTEKPRWSNGWVAGWLDWGLDDWMNSVYLLRSVMMLWVIGKYPYFQRHTFQSLEVKYHNAEIHFQVPQETMELKLHDGNNWHIQVTGRWVSIIPSSVSKIPQNANKTCSLKELGLRQGVKSWPVPVWPHPYTFPFKH